MSVYDFRTFLQKIDDENCTPKNEEQKKALELLCTSDDNVYLIEKAGTGKSWIVGKYREYCQMKLKKIAILTPTGIAVERLSILTTFIPTKEGWLFLCIVLDLCSRRIVGWAMALDMKADLVVDALKMSIKARKPALGLVFHSDCGGQYKARRFRSLLRRHPIRQSMTHAGNCYDNATAESFFGTLKTELVRRWSFSTRKQAKAAIFEYVEVFYNRLRMHSSIGYQSSAEFEQKLAS